MKRNMFFFLFYTHAQLVKGEILATDNKKYWKILHKYLNILGKERG